MLLRGRAAFVTGVALAVAGGWLAEKGFGSPQSQGSSFLVANATMGREDG